MITKHTIIKKYLAEIGRKGGRAATGETKRRSPEHYKTIGAMGAQKRWAGHKKANNK